MFSILFICPVSNLLARINGPILPFPYPTGPDDKKVCRLKSEDVPVQRLLLVDDRAGQILPDHPFVRLTPDAWIFKDLPKFGATQERAAIGVIIEGSHTQEIARAEKLPLAPIPDHKREVPDDLP